ncbi:hypothetical protein B0G83_102558 [Paraburkholderia sp. BL21I4N1]|nr:hypothetical protein B0G83_102558 [Paraburkholderia sp. BL21I4N1]
MPAFITLQQPFHAEPGLFAPRLRLSHTGAIPV